MEGASRKSPRGRIAFAILFLASLPSVAGAELPRRHIVEAADVHTAEIGRAMLRQGGSAVDAAIAMAIAVTLVEPQSAGIGGGGFLIHYAARDRSVTTFDGRETAPAAARPDRFLSPDGKPLPFFDAVVSGRSVGVPGLLRMLALAHRRFGKLPWAALVEPTIRLAEEGFAISPRLHQLLVEDRFLARDPQARALYFAADGTPKPTGTRIADPVLAASLRLVAENGADAFYSGPIAADILAALRSADPPGDLSEADLAGYKAKERAPVCGLYRAWRICGMGPPSSGGVAVLEILDLLQPFDLAHRAPNDTAWHLFAEASRLAYADRARWLGDPEFTAPPVAGLLDPAYLASRSRLIDPEHAHEGRAAPGDPPGRRADAFGDSAAPELPSTTTLAAIDDDGDAAAATVTIENTFGSRIMVRGFLLNNELTDFSFVPEQEGRPVANRVEPGKRPLSAMAPSLVFDGEGKLLLAIGSAGGPAIITDVAKTILAVLDWHDDLATAIALPNISNRNGPTEIEAGPGAEALAAALQARGHQPRVTARASGLGGIRVTAEGYEGAVDPRREGAALGD